MRLQISVVLLCLISSLLLIEAATQSCMIITMWDSFGDGWGNAKLYVENPSKKMLSFTPSCTDNPLVTTICGNNTVGGQYYIMVLNGKEEPPENFWEVYFAL